MTRRVWISMASGVFAVGLLAGCGEDEQSREEQIESYAREYGLDVDVDVGEDGEVKSVELQNFSVGGIDSRAGSNLGLPDGFPEDIAIYPGLNVYSATATPQGHVVQGTASADQPTIAEFYASQMADAGWTDATDAPTNPAMTSLRFTKEGRSVSVNLIPGGASATTVQITTVTLD